MVANISWRRFDDSLDSALGICVKQSEMHLQHLITVYDVVAAELPPALRAVLTPEDLQAIEQGPAFFQQLAKKARFDWLQRLLEHCSECHGWHLERFATGDDAPTPYFRFDWHGNPGLCLPRTATQRTDMPPVLNHFYSLVGAFKESDFTNQGGVFHADQLQSVAEMNIPVADESSVDPKQAIAFLATFTGSQLCYLPDGSGAWLEEGRFKVVKNLGSEMGRYFKAMLRGTRL
jgi:hypothetical protein